MSKILNSGNCAICHIDNFFALWATTIPSIGNWNEKKNAFSKKQQPTLWTMMNRCAVAGWLVPERPRGRTAFSYPILHKHVHFEFNFRSNNNDLNESAILSHIYDFVAKNTCATKKCNWIKFEFKSRSTYPVSRSKLNSISMNDACLFSGGTLSIQRTHDCEWWAVIRTIIIICCNDLFSVGYCEWFTQWKFKWLARVWIKSA